MNGHSTLMSVANTAPTQQPANNNAATRMAQDYSPSNFQQTMDDVQAAKEKKSKVSVTTTDAIEKQKLSKNNTAVAKNNRTKANDNAARQQVDQPADNVHKSVKNTDQISNKSKANISNQDKLNNENEEEKQQEVSGQLISNTAAAIPAKSALGLGLEQPVATTLANDETVDFKIESELDSSEGGAIAVAQLDIHTSTSTDTETFVSNIVNAPLSSYQTKTHFNESIEEASVALASTALAATAASMSLKNSSNASTALVDGSLMLSDEQTIDTTMDSKSLFEKMVQTVTAKQMDASNKTFDQLVGEGGDNSLNANTTTPLGSVLDSLSRGPDSLSPAGRSFVAQTAIPVTVGQPQWSQAVGEKVLWLAAQNITAAEIRLDPLDLGPMQVKVSVNQDQASVSFTSHHASVREVLDQNLNRLRDMFNEQGLNLVNVDVSDKSFQRHQGEGKGPQSHGDSTELVDDETPVSISAILQQRLVDHYA